MSNFRSMLSISSHSAGDVEARIVAAFLVCLWIGIATRLAEQADKIMAEIISSMYWVLFIFFVGRGRWHEESTIISTKIRNSLKELFLRRLNVLLNQLFLAAFVAC